MKFDIRDNRAEVLTWLDQLHSKQIPFATKNAINACAKKMVLEVGKKMRSEFDRPTPITLRSFALQKGATKADPVAVVWLKDKPLGASKAGGYNPLSMSDMIGHQFGGGGRIHKNYERVLISKGFMERGEFTVPGIAARLDNYGNISNGMIVQILSQIGIKRSGSDSTPTGIKRSSRNVLKAGEMFWSRGPGTRHYKTLQSAIDERGRLQHLPKGVWMRIMGKALPVLLVVKPPHYSQRIDLDALAQAAVDRDFSREFDAALDSAML